MGAGNDERICIETTLQKLLSLDNLQEVRNSEYLTDKGCLSGVRGRKQIASTRSPFTKGNNPIALDLSRNFPR